MGTLLPDIICVNGHNLDFAGGSGSRQSLRPAEAVSALILSAKECNSISGLVVEYIVAIDVTRVRFPADAFVVPLINKMRRRK